VQRAKRLLNETTLSVLEIAVRAGFGSLRRFNSVFAEVYRRPPTDIRRLAIAKSIRKTMTQNQVSILRVSVRREPTPGAG
jgi:AraC-like DNA-binding protein